MANGYGEFKIAIGESCLDNILQLKGPEQATLEKPPAHCFFDSTIISPVLQMRKDAKEAKKLTKNTSAGTSHLPAGFMNLATALRTPTPIPAPHPYHLIPQNNAITTSHTLSYQSTELLVHPSILKVFACSSVWIYLCIRSCQTKATKLLIISNMLQSQSSKRQGSGLARPPLSRMLLHADHCLRTSSQVYCCCLIVPDSYFFPPHSFTMLFPQLL